MKKEEREAYRKKIKLHEKLGAKKFQKVVFKVEEVKWNLLKKLCPNYIRYADKYIDFQKKRKLKRAKTEQEQKQVIRSAKFQKMAVRKGFNQDVNANYHMNRKRVTEIYKHLEWNKSVHMNGLKRNAILIPTSIAGIALGFTPAIALLVFELISAGINFQCVNIQDYNICRYKLIEDKLQNQEQRRLEQNIKNYGQAAEVIHKTVEQQEQLPSIDDILKNVRSKEQLQQLRDLFAREEKERVAVMNRGNK